MLVVERMSTNPATVSGNATVKQALDSIVGHHQWILPVVDEQQSLVGIVSEKDLLRADALDLVEAVMTRDVITVTEYAALEEAARIMADHRVSSLPVMRGSKLVGIITETDLFRVFLELLGAR